MSANPSIWVVMLALLGTHLAGMGAFLTVPVLAPAIAAEAGIPAALAGFHTALVYGGALVSGPVTGELIRRYGGIRVLQGGLVLIGIGIALAAFGHPLALLASAVLGGLGHGPVTPSGSHLLASRTPPQRRSLIFSLKQCGVPAGAMLIAAAAPVVGGIWGWRAGVLAVAAFVAASALALQPLRRALDAERVGAARGGFASVWKAGFSTPRLLKTEPQLRSVTLMSALYGVSQFCFGSFFVVWQVEHLGVKLAEAGLALAFAQGAGIAGRVGWGLLADRVGAGRVLLGIGIGVALSGLALALAGPDWPRLAVVVAGIAMGATAVAWNGVLLGEAARLAPAGQVGAATAALGFVFGLMMLVGPPAFSVLVHATGDYTPGFLLCMATAVLGVMALAQGRRDRAAS